jgi:hypothetical protein
VELLFLLLNRNQTTKAERPQTESKYSQAKKGNINPGEDDWNKTSIEQRASKAKAYRQNHQIRRVKFKANKEAKKHINRIRSEIIPEFFERQDQEQIRAARRRRQE